MMSSTQVVALYESSHFWSKEMLQIWRLVIKQLDQDHSTYYRILFLQFNRTTVFFVWPHAKEFADFFFLNTLYGVIFQWMESQFFFLVKKERKKKAKWHT